MALNPHSETGSAVSLGLSGGKNLHGPGAALRVLHVPYRVPRSAQLGVAIPDAKLVLHSAETPADLNTASGLRALLKLC